MEKLYNDDVNISVLTVQMEILQVLLKDGDYFCFDDHKTVLNIHKERTDRLSTIDIANEFTDRNTNRKRNFGTFRVNDVQ